LDIHHIRYFLALCETLSFTAAAERTHVAQPALSRAIRQLEEEVGGPLIRRDRGGNSLTELGQLMKPRFEHIISELGQVKHEARQFFALDKASLSFGVTCTIGPTRLAALLIHFAKKCPGVSLRMIEGVPEQLAAKLKSRDIDLALMVSPNGFPAELSVEVLYRERFVVAFAHGHRLGNMNAVPMAAIDGESYLSRLNCEHYDMLSRLVAERGAHSPTGFASEREDWIQNLVAAGLGICFMPEFSALIPGVQTRPLIDPDVWRDVCLVTLRDGKPSAACERFLTALRDYPYPNSRFDEAGIVSQLPSHVPALSI
jgi:DNA-binding transcriptional LysR family regulator